MAFVTLSHNGCALITTDYQAVHEIGHLLFAQHQVIYNSDGIATNEVDGDENPELPFKDNHPKVDYPYRTIMYSDGPSSLSVYFSRKGKYFSSPSAPAFGLYEDVARVFGETYDYVARYVEPPPTTEPCFIIAQRICGLPPSSLNAFVTVTPWLTGHTIIDMDIDYKIGGTWNNMYDGPQSCPAMGLSLSSSVIFNAVLTTTVGISSCSLTVVAAELPSATCEPRRIPSPRF